jgi:hypothetical protein
VLLGATSETNRRLRTGIVSDNPNPGLVRWLQGSHHSATRHACRRKLLPRSGRELLAELNADPRSGLAAFSRPPSGPPCGVPSGFPSCCLAAFRRGSAGFISELVIPCASSGRRSMRIHEIQTFSPPFQRSSPVTARESPTLPHDLSIQREQCATGPETSHTRLARGESIATSRSLSGSGRHLGWSRDRRGSFVTPGA